MTRLRLWGPEAEMGRYIGEANPLYLQYNTPRGKKSRGL